jgi:hypothetical protein
MTFDVVPGLCEGSPLYEKNGDRRGPAAVANDRSAAVSAAAIRYLAGGAGAVGAGGGLRFLKFSMALKTRE